MDNVENQSLRTGFRFAFKEMRISILEQLLNYYSDDEYYLLSMAELLTISKQKKLLSLIFDKSKWFGAIMRAEFNILWTIEEIREILPITGIPCILGFWMPGKNNEIFILKHYSCNSSPNLLKCRYWYNAINGLITGLSDIVSFARHESIGNEDNSCTNIIFNSKYTDQFWKDIPPEISKKIKYLTMHLSTFGINLKFEGYADGTLFYHLEGKNNKFLIETVLKLHSFREPNLQFVNVSDKEKISKSSNTLL